MSQTRQPSITNRFINILNIVCAAAVCATTVCATTVPAFAQPSDLVPVPQTALTDVESPLRDELTSARANLDEAIDDASVEPTALATAFGVLGGLYLSVHEVPAAAACLTNATRLAPEEARWYMLLGATRLAQDDPTQALAAFETAQRLTPNDPVVHLRLGQLLAGDSATVERSITHLQAARAGLKDNREILLSLGKALAQTGRHQEAIEAFDGVLVLDPEDRVAVNYRARARSQVGDDAGAATDLEGLVAREPKNRQARLDLAAIRTRQGDFAAAEAQLVAALDLDLKPQARVMTLFNLAGLRQQVGDHDGAIRRYREVLALVPDLPDAHYNLGVALARAGRFAEAVTAFERVTHLTPAAGAAWIALARALISAEQPDEATAALERGLMEGAEAGMAAPDVEQLQALRASLGSS